MVGGTVGHYKVLEALGAGGMGEVFIAHDTTLDRRVALKVLPASVAADPDRRDRFTREARAVAALSHPNIVTIHSVEQAGETYFLTMELVDGRTLADPRRNFIFALRDDVVSEPIETLPRHPDPAQAFRAYSWSPDGRMIAGDVAGGEIWIYSFDTKTYSRIADGAVPVWLRDSRRLVYASAGRLFVVDTVATERREILARSGEFLGDPSVTQDGRSLYFTHATTGADIWLMTFK